MSDPMRDMLLRLICAAPGPMPGDGVPHYEAAWNDARRLLAETCPSRHRHGDPDVVLAGTCNDCHADTAQ